MHDIFAVHLLSVCKQNLMHIVKFKTMKIDCDMITLKFSCHETLLIRQLFCISKAISGDN